MATSEILRFGRVTMDDKGIRQKKTLLLFGESFDFKWQDITAFAVAEFVLASAQSERVLVRVLELHTRAGLHHVQWAGPEKSFNELVAYVRERLPDKEIESLLKQLRPGAYR